MILRYAEVLLSYVEALIEDDQWNHPDVVKYLNEVRARAAMPPVDVTVYNSQAKLRELVRRERQSELAFEGGRFHDIRRWGILGDVMNGQVYGAIDPATNEPVKVEVRSCNAARDYRWPIPQAEILANTNMVQNDFLLTGLKYSINQYLFMNRRSLIKQLGLSIGATVIGSETMARLSDGTLAYEVPKNPLHKPLDKPVTAITLGAGGRGNVYGNYAAKYPNMLKIVGVAEPNTIRNDRYSTKHQIADANRFDTWERVFERPKFSERHHYNHAG